MVIRIGLDNLPPILFSALLALTLYSMLPVLRNTITGLQGVDPAILEAAQGVGMTPRQSLFTVELPLALPVILAGVKTAAVTSVGTATIAAFIGAGGYGERITIGLALNDNDMLLAGAIPALVIAARSRSFVMTPPLNVLGRF